MRKLPKLDGFTLIELLITMVIIAILAMIGITVFWRAKDRGLEASLQSDLKTVAVQQEIYFGSRGTYASTCPFHEAWMRSRMSPIAVSRSMGPARRRPVRAPRTAINVQSAMRPAMLATRLT